MTMDPTDLPTAWLDRSASRSVSLPRIVTLGAPATRGLFFGPAEMARIRVELRMADVLHLHNIWSPLTLQVAAAAARSAFPTSSAFTACSTTGASRRATSRSASS